MIKRLAIFVLAIAAILFFALKDDKVPTNSSTDTSTEVSTDASESTEAESRNDEKSVLENAEEAVKAVETSATKAVSTIPTAIKAVTKAPVAIKAAPTIDEPVADAATNVKVYLYEWNIDSSALNIPAGSINFEVVNTGTFSHSFGIKGGTDFGRVSPGETKFFTTNLSAGDFVLYSSKSVDMERGMEEAFTVQ